MARYKVVGKSGHKVFGASYGEVIERKLSARQERFLIEAGHIKPVVEPRRKPPRRKPVVLVKEEDQPLAIWCEPAAVVPDLGHAVEQFGNEGDYSGR